MNRKTFSLAALLIIAVAFSGCTQTQQEGDGLAPINDAGTRLTDSENPDLPNQEPPLDGPADTGISDTPAPSEEDDASTQGIDDAIRELDQLE